MHKHTYKAEKITRLSLSVVLPLAFYLGCNFIEVSSILWLIPFTFILVLLFALPLIITLNKFKNEAVDSVKTAIVIDLLYYLLPSVLVSFLLGLLLFLFFQAFEHVFILTIILVIVYVLTCPFFWLLYLINNTLVKKFGDK